MKRWLHVCQKCGIFKYKYSLWNLPKCSKGKNHKWEFKEKELGADENGQETR